MDRGRPIKIGAGPARGSNRQCFGSMALPFIARYIVGTSGPGHYLSVDDCHGSGTWVLSSGVTVMIAHLIGAPERSMQASAVSRAVWWRSAAAT